jgi:sulfite dehydrogenase (cytochrome) subunit A
MNAQREDRPISRRQFLAGAGIAAGSLFLAASCRKTLTTTTTVVTTTTVPPTTSTSPPTTVRLPPVNGLEYLVNSDPSTIDNSKLPVTPPQLLHALNPSPVVDIATYRLNIHGAVSTPLNLTYNDLSQFSSISKTELLICPTVFADNETLDGFSLPSLLAAAGVKPGAIQLVFRSLDSLQQNVALSDALAGDIFMALKVDGQTLTQAHGFPLRLVRPGQIGVFWLKCIDDIEVL